MDNVFKNSVCGNLSNRYDFCMTNMNVKKELVKKVVLV